MLQGTITRKNQEDPKQRKFRNETKQKVDATPIAAIANGIENCKFEQLTMDFEYFHIESPIPNRTVQYRIELWNQ